MSHILVITFDDEQQGPAVLKSLKSLEHSGQLNLEDAAVIVKNAEGKVEIKNMVDSGVKIGAVGGATLGLLVGSILFPFTGIILGALGGALVGKTLDKGVDKKFIKEVRDSLAPSSSGILFIVGKENVGVLIAALEPYKGKIYQSSFDTDAEKELRKALE